MALSKMKIVGRRLDDLHTPLSLPQAARLSSNMKSHGSMLPRPFSWNPYASVKLPKIHGGGRSRVLHTTTSSVHDGTFPASASPSPKSSNDLLQPSSVSRTAATTAPSTPPTTVQRIEELIEKAIFNCRFFTLMGVVGSLTGSVLCFFKGCTFVVESFREYVLSCLQGVGTGKVVLLLVEAVDIYLMGTVMLIFGMGLYELFISTLDVPGATVCRSNLFGLFPLKERPKWLEIRSLDELKTKLGHVIVMILLVGMFDKSKKVPVHSGLDLLCFSASILLSSGCLYFLSKLNSD